MSPSACDACLRRTALLAALSPWLDLEWRRRTAPAGVLGLPDEVLIALDRSGRAARGWASFAAQRARAAVAAAGLQVVCRCDPAYPERLRELADPPAVLHVLGRAAGLEREDAVAVVGARRGTRYGLEVARSLAQGLTAADVPVVSGLALGVDSAAHAGAVEALDAAGRGGAPVAVLAGAAEIAYPASRRGLHRRVAEYGCVVSEMPPGFTARRWSFVARNRIIAGLAALTVVVEATERSGSLTTADFAEQLGRAVGAVPGPVTSRFSGGANTLLAAGAVVVRDVRDVLDHLRGPDAPLPEPVPPAVPIEPRLRRLLDAVERGHGTLAELATEPDATRQVLEDLTDLELRGLVRREFGGRYVRALDGLSRGGT